MFRVFAAQLSFRTIVASLIVLAGISNVTAATPPQKLALLVGIGSYPQRGANPWRPLHTHDDVLRMKEVLIQRFAFSPADIQILEDGAATAAGIRNDFRKHLIEQARPGAVVVFYFAGHGQQVLDDDGDELDGLDETLVPHDATNQSAKEGARTNIRDDELSRWLAALKLRMSEQGKVVGSINVFLDSCFAGTATRGLLDERGRGWEDRRDGQRPTTSAQPGATRDGATGLLPVGEAETQGYVLLTATQSDQTAKEIGGMGAFTRALITALTQSNERTTYRALHDQILVELARRVRDQTPELEGPRDQLLFSGAARPTSPYLLVKPLGREALELPIGELHGATTGSRFRLYPAGSDLTEQTGFAAAQIESVEPFRSIARLIDKFRYPAVSELLNAARAVETQHVYHLAPLLVHVEGLTQIPALATRITELDVLTRQGAGPRNYQLAIRWNPVRRVVELRRQESDTPFATVPLDDSTVTRVEKLLQGEWHWRHLMQLRQPNPYVQASLRFIPLRAALPRSSHLRLAVGDLVMFELKNDTVNDLYVNIIELGPDGSITPIFPSVDGRGDNLIAGGATRELPFLFQVKPPLGCNVYKVIATADKVDFSSLLYAPPETSRGGRRAPNLRVEPRRFGVTESFLHIEPQERLR